jgi:hypothetical protein
LWQEPDLPHLDDVRATGLKPLDQEAAAYHLRIDGESGGGIDYTDGCAVEVLPVGAPHAATHPSSRQPLRNRG